MSIARGSLPLRIQRLRRRPRPAVGVVKRRPFADNEADLVFAPFAQGGDGVADQGDDFLKLGEGDGESEIRFARQLDLVYTDREKH